LPRKRDSKKDSSEHGELSKTNTKRASPVDVHKDTELQEPLSLVLNTKLLKFSLRLKELELQMAPLTARFHRGLSALTTARDSCDIQAFVVAVNELRHASEAITKMVNIVEKEVFEAYQ
jgi:hypothetical protein